MSKKTESVLGLVPMPQPPSLSLTGGGQAFGLIHADAKKERQIVAQWHEQSLVIDAQAAKTVFGLERMADIHQQAAFEFMGTASYIDGLKQEAQGTGYQAAADEFGTYLLQVSARHYLAAVDSGDAGIVAEIQRSLYPPPERKGFWQRVFGE